MFLPRRCWLASEKQLRTGGLARAGYRFFRCLVLCKFILRLIRSPFHFICGRLERVSFASQHHIYSLLFAFLRCASAI